MISQIPLGLKWPEEATFETFYTSKNSTWLTYLQKMLQEGNEHLLYLYPLDLTPIGIAGKQGVGLTHLLYSACHQTQQQGKTAAYLPLSKLALSEAWLEGLENLHLVCLDDVEAVRGDLAKETALFHFYNRAHISGVQMLMASHASPDQPWILPDLASRLSSGIVITVPALSEMEKIAVLQQRAKQRGLEISNKAGQYLLQHYSRDMGDLLKAFEKLDYFSLVCKRHLTIPLIKEALILGIENKSQS